ncbi:protein of unknown function UPF0066 [Ignisphaera aggregans DSM 17230]|uniref:TsaA-like domain-containing protein n=1 Tax=Ignisphaera aggregans (strain DSM 17230 / JCM 13409 / AQ1.S1) TaxID=583356 RepID=E0SNT7_IGNAA|nr:protein of unknown function UPF0066 [Ignisphaera aggregans DSM 17230]
MEIVFRPIGYVRTRYSDEEVSKSIEGVDGYIEILPEYEEGLDGIEDFSHLVVIAYLHKVDRNSFPLRVKPFRKFARVGISLPEVPLVGVFVSNSPHRPNPIALTIVKLVKRNRNILYVSSLDLYDGTPILDLKPYGYGMRIKDIKVPRWYEEAWNLIKSIFRLTTLD